MATDSEGSSLLSNAIGSQVLDDLDYASSGEGCIDLGSVMRAVGILSPGQETELPVLDDINAEVGTECDEEVKENSVPRNMDDGQGNVQLPTNTQQCNWVQQQQHTQQQQEQL